MRENSMQSLLPDREELDKQFKKYHRKEEKKRLSEKKPGNGFELRIPKSVILNEEYQKIFRGPMTIYEFLWAHIVRGKMRKDIFNIKKNYYDDKKLLACTFSYRYLMGRLKMSHHTIRKHIKEFVDAGILRVKKMEIGKKRYQNIYILGYWTEEDGVKKDRLYLIEMLN